MNKRAEMKTINEEQANKIEQLRICFSGMYDAIEQLCLPGRETSLALTKLEESQFWAIKGISREGVNNG